MGAERPEWQRAKARLEKRFSQLSDEQREVVDSFGLGMAVIAGAGSGKTSTLVTKCLALLRRNPEARFAAVSFTERSTQDLRQKLSEGILDWSRVECADPSRFQGEPLSGQLVSTIHGLCASVVREFPEEAGLEGDFAILSESEGKNYWQTALDSLWSDQLPQVVGDAWERILEFGETQETVSKVLTRLRELEGFGVLDRLIQAENQPSGEGPGGDPRIPLLRVLFPYVAQKYERRKKRSGLIDFADLEKGAKRALEVSRVRSWYQKRFDLFLVDEFQDTNLLQAQILWALVRTDLSNLCVVGDPKQSIYRFRDADVSVFEELTARLPLQKRLTWNFRCRPEIVDYVNSVCAPAFEASQMRYDAMVAQRESGDPERTGVYQFELEDPRELADWILAEQAQGIGLEKMALLLRKIRGNEKWLLALERAGVPLGISSGGLFWEDPRVLELVAFLSAWCFPGDRLSFAAFLRAPWMSLPPSEKLCTEQSPEQCSNQWPDQWPDQWLDKHFSSAQSGIKRVGDASSSAGRASGLWAISPWEEFLSLPHPVAQGLKSIWVTSQKMPIRPGELLRELLDLPGLGSAVLGLWHRAEELSSQGLSFPQIVREFKKSVEEKRREREVPPPEQLGLLPVLTLHGAKGLEFEHVILVDFPERARAGSAPDFFWDRHEGLQLAIRDEDGAREADAPAELRWRSLERSKDLAESKRVFYVALTRARERLILVKLQAPLSTSLSSPGVEKKKKKEPPPPFSLDHWRRWVETVPPKQSIDTIEFSKVPSSESTTQGQSESSDSLECLDRWKEEAAQIPVRLQRHSVSDWVLGGRCAKALALKHFPVPPLEVDSQRSGSSAVALDSSTLFESADSSSSVVLPATPSGLPEAGSPALTAAELGTAVHRCLEIQDFEGLERLEEQVGSTRLQARVLKDWASRSPLMASRSASVEVHTELGFEICLEGEVLLGALDRLVRDESGTYHLIDFKVTESPASSAVQGSDSAAEARLIARYRDQLLHYARAVREMQSALDQEAALRIWLVWIQAQGVREIEVTYQDSELNSRIAELASIAKGVLATKTGVATPSRQCRYCPVQASCEEGLQWERAEGR
jgi:ATP-dependent exoDNAse (exonuclease V) beta subunit